MTQPSARSIDVLMIDDFWALALMLFVSMYARMQNYYNPQKINKNNAFQVI